MAADELLEDSHFATKARKHVHLLRLILLSGRHTVVPASPHWDLEAVLGLACHRLGMPAEGAFLLHGTDRVPQAMFVRDWPGMKPEGKVTDYQLMVSAQQSC
eukprot:2690801-Amphidinium_carterae.1